MRNRIVLKRYLESGHIDKNLLVEYGRNLEKQGWRQNIIDGGYFSPDGSTIFITDRAPYNGELLQAARYKQAEYLALVEELIEGGDFMRY